MRRKYETTTMFPGISPKIILPGDKSNHNICIKTHGGVGLTQEWMDNMPYHIKEYYKSYISRELEPEFFIWNMYSYFVEKFKFVIEFEYLNRNSSKYEHRKVVRGNLHINDEFKVGLDWRSNKWSTIQQTMIEFLQHSGSYGGIDNMQKKDAKTISSVVELFEID